MLEELRKTCKNNADLIQDWQNMNKNDLANLYIKYEKNERLRSAVFGALMCRYWGNIGKYYNQSRNSVEIEECYEWLVHAISYALRKRKWTDPSNKLYSDPNGPDKVINMCIKSTRSIFYQAANTDKRRSNFGQVSMESQVEQLGDFAEASFLDEDNPFAVNPMEDIVGELSCVDIIKYLYSTKQIVEALVVDGICFFDTYKKIKNKKDSTMRFNERLLAKHLTTLSPKFKKYFMSRYDVKDSSILDIEISRFSQVSSTRVYAIIRKALYNLKTNGELRGVLGLC